MKLKHTSEFGANQEAKGEYVEIPAEVGKVELRKLPSIDEALGNFESCLG